VFFSISLFFTQGRQIFMEMKQILQVNLIASNSSLISTSLGLQQLNLRMHINIHPNYFIQKVLLSLPDLLYHFLKLTPIFLQKIGDELILGVTPVRVRLLVILWCGWVGLFRMQGNNLNPTTPFP